MTKNRGLLIGIGLGCLALVTCASVTGGALILGGAIALRDAFSVPEDISVGVIAPATAQVGAPFSILVRVNNLASDEQMLDSIDIETSYLEGVVIESSSPDYVETFGIIGWQSYTYLQRIPPESELIVQIIAVPVAAGDYSGAIDVCINTGANCITRELRTIVTQ